MIDPEPKPPDPDCKDCATGLLSLFCCGVFCAAMGSH
jgi:hypothetical protein